VRVTSNNPRYSGMATPLHWLLFHIIRLGIGAIFVWSGLSKIQRSYEFLTDVYRYELVGPKLGLLIAIVLPWLELIVGVCLLGSVLAAGAFLAAVVLAGMFAFANAYAIHRGLAINCGRFGGDSDTVGYATLFRAIGLLLAAGAGYFLSLRDASRPHKPPDNEQRAARKAFCPA